MDWFLPNVVNEEGLQQVYFEPAAELVSHVSFDKDAMSIKYNGEGSGEKLEGKILPIKITLVNTNGAETSYVQIISF